MAKKKSSGWLDKYDDGGPIQPNYNDASVSYPDNFVGEGTINGPNWKSPAWGGQFKNGGKVCDSCQKAQDGKKVSGDEKRKKVLAKAEEVFANSANPYTIPENVVKAGGNSNYVCIQGVCGILSDSGIIPQDYYTNTKFAEKAKDLGFGRAMADISLIKPGDVVQHMSDQNEQGTRFPSHAEIFKRVNPDTGEYEFYDYFDKYNGLGGIRTYSKDELEERFNRFKTRDNSGIQAQFFSLDPESLPQEAPQPFPYNLPQKEQEQYFDATHVANTKYYPGDAAQGPLLDVPSYERMQTKHELTDLFNNKELDKKLRKELKITDQDLQKAKPLIYGIMDQETDFGNPRSAGRNIKYGLKELLGSGAYSMGPAAVRYDEALSDEAKKAFGIKGPHDLSKVKNAYIGALDVLSKGARYTDNNIAGHPGLENKDRMERALYWYNNPSNVVNSDAETFQAISKEANNLFPWQDKQELMSKAYNSPLQMSPGSYPDKVLQQSKGLHQVIDFNDMNVLPEVRVVAPKEEVVQTTGGQFQMGGSMPGAVGFTYARTGGIPSNGPYAKKTKASAQNGTWLDKAINKLYDAEDDITKRLGNPMQKATNIAKEASYKHLGSMDDPIDSYRHSMAGNYTSKAIQDKLYNIPLVSQAAGFVGANVLGAGHEISTLIGHAPEFGGDDDRPWLDKIKESGEDAFNNMVGAGVGSIPFMSAKQKSDLLLNMSLNNRLPDGHGQGNMYIKKKQNGGKLDKDVKTVYSGMLPEITVVGSKDPQTEEFYRTILDRLTKEEGYKNGISSDDPVYNNPKDVDMVYNYPIATDNILGRYEGLMDLGKKYGFPKVHPVDENSFVSKLAAVQSSRVPEINNRPPANYNPLTKTIEADSTDEWFSEMAHRKQFNEHPFSTAFKALTNDLPVNVLGKNPYETSGTIEHEAHSIIEPKLLEEMKQSESKYKNSPYRKKKIDEFYGDDFYKNLGAYQNGGEMKFYQEGLDWKPKSISKNGSVIKDDRGQWAHPGKITQIGSNQITMQGVPYPVLGISDTGDTQMMYPNQDYTYQGSSVTEYPMMQQGGQLTKLNQLTNFTNYNTKQPGGWLDKYQD